jgi:hypothetical protein
VTEPTFRRRAILIIVGGAGLAIGLAVGLLLRPISADWFEAVGTWVGVIVSTSAVALAVVVFRSEDFMRRMEHARETAASEAASEAERNRQQELADLVLVKCMFGSGHNYQDGRLVANELRHSVHNSSSEPIVQVDYRHPEYQPDFARLVDALAPYEATPWASIRVEGREVTHEGLARAAEVKFRLNGATWRKRGEEPAVRDA